MMRVEEGDGPPRDVEVVEGLVIGRHADCGLMLKDAYASNRHATIVRSGPQLAVMDLGSENGTTVNDDEVLREGEERLLEDGLRIQVGESTISIVSLPSEAKSAGEASDSPSSEAPTVDLPPWKVPRTDPASLDETVHAESPFHGADGGSSRPQSRRRKGRRAEDQSSDGPPQKRTPADYVERAKVSSMDEFDERDPRTLIAESDHAIAAAARLKSMGARLIIVNEADLRIVPLDRPEFTIGRADQSALWLENRGVSLEHALIRFQPAGHTFVLEDLGSVNGTLHTSAPVLEGVPCSLESDAHLRFGTIEAVFMQDLDADLVELPESRQDDAIKLLVSRGKLSTQATKLAEEEALEEDISLGEALLIGQHVSPRDWCSAVKDARLALDLGVLSESNAQPRIALVVLLVVVSLIALVLAL